MAIQKIVCLTVLGAFIGLLGCASADYLTDRRRDLSDCAITRGGSGAGLKVRVGPFATGLVYAVYNRRVPAGELGRMSEAYALLLGGEESIYGTAASLRRKTYKAEHWLILMPFDWEEKKFDFPSLTYYTQIEVSAGYGKIGKIGVNPGEIVDFLLGWTTLDLYRDDIGLYSNAAESESATIPNDQTLNPKSKIENPK